MLIKITSLEITTEAAFYAAHPNISFPAPLTDEVLASFGYAILHETPYPDYDSWTHRLIEGAPEQRGGKWYQTWTLESITHTKEENERYIQDAIENKHNEIISKANEKSILVKSNYSLLEIDSWPIQQKEAELVLSGQVLPEDSLLVSLAKTNNMSIEDFAKKVMLKVSNAKMITDKIVSQQHAYELKLKQAKTIQEINDMIIVYDI